MERWQKKHIENKILDAVIRCKHETMGGDIRITQVAAAAGVSTRTLHRYFPEKDEMIYSAAVKFLEERYERLAQQYYSADMSGTNGLERITRFLRLLGKAYDIEAACALMLIDANIRYTCSAITKNYKKVSIGGRLREIIVSNIEAGIRDGSIRSDIVPLNTSLLISANFHGLMERVVFIYYASEDNQEKNCVSVVFDEFIKMLDGYLRA